MSRPDPRIGTSVLGYEILDVIGTGSWARVYRARNARSGETRAVKVLEAPGKDQDQATKRFAREAKLLHTLSHPNLVKIEEVGLTEDDRPCFVMELLEGRTLRQVLEQEGAFEPRRAAGIAIQIAAGLSAAHDKGIIHRDLKPTNVMISGPRGDERVKVLDFGLARAPASAGESLTRTGPLGSLLGNPAYMAPEQIVEASSVGPESDLYALGILLYEMLAGRPPFTGPVVSILEAQLRQPPPKLPGPDTPLEGLVRRLLMKEPARRPQTAEAVRVALRSLYPRPKSEIGFALAAAGLVVLFVVWAMLMRG